MGFGMFTNDTTDTSWLVARWWLTPNQQERTGTNKPCLAFLG